MPDRCSSYPRKITSSDFTPPIFPYVILHYGAFPIICFFSDVSTSPNKAQGPVYQLGLCPLNSHSKLWFFPLIEREKTGFWLPLHKTTRFFNSHVWEGIFHAPQTCHWCFKFRKVLLNAPGGVLSHTSNGEAQIQRMGFHLKLLGRIIPTHFNFPYKMNRDITSPFSQVFKFQRYYTHKLFSPSLKYRLFQLLFFLEMFSKHLL